MKARKAVAQPGSRSSKTQSRLGDLADASIDLSRQTYLTVRQTRHYLGFPSEMAVYHWAIRYAVRKCRRGSMLLFLSRDLDEAVQQDRHGRAPRHTGNS
jgi:hypothetical protein